MPPAEKFGTGSLPAFRHHADQFIRCAMLLRRSVKFFFAQHGQLAACLCTIWRSA